MQLPPNELEQVKFRFNPEHFHTKANRILDDTTKEECEQWYSHPCTKVLINALEGDISAIVLMWMSGGYSKEESIEATAQRQAKARGMLQGIEDVLEHLKQIKNRKVDGEEYSDGN